MKKTKIIYWTVTGLFALMMLGSAIPDIMSSDVAIKGMHDGLGYPLYFIPFIGVAKVLGVIAIVIPGSARLKEWAYAGLFFDLVGATFSIYSSGERGANLAFMLLPILVGALSYVYFRKKQSLSQSQFNFA
jgi:uncharacterized membrane protein YphA (DoxX/SURF4 family)